MRLLKIGSIAVVSVGAALLTVACSGNANPTGASTVTVPADCSESDYAPVDSYYSPSLFPLVARPECVVREATVDLSHDGYVVVRDSESALALPILLSNGSIPNLAATPQEYVEMYGRFWIGGCYGGDCADVLEMVTNDFEYFDALPVDESGLTRADFLSPDDFRTSLDGDVITVRDGGVRTDWDADQDDITVTRTQDQVTFEWEFGRRVEWCPGTIRVVMPGTVTDATGAISGNTVTWTCDGTETDLGFYAVSDA